MWIGPAKKAIKGTFSLFGLNVSRSIPKGMPVCWPANSRIPQTCFETDRDFHEQYDLAQQKTQMVVSDNPLRRNRHYLLHQMIRQAPIECGDVVELGCWRGLSAFQIASYLNQNRKRLWPNKFLIFDSFEGLSEIGAIDRPAGISADTSKDHDRRTQFAASLDVVKSNLSCFDDLLVYYKGWIPDRFDEVQNHTFSFVHVDVDLYQPIKSSIEFFFPRLVERGIMVFDDYGCTHFPGAKRAVDEFFVNVPGCIFLPTPAGSAFLIKLA